MVFIILYGRGMNADLCCTMLSNKRQAQVIYSAASTLQYSFAFIFVVFQFKFSLFLNPWYCSISLLTPIQNLYLAPVLQKQ